MAEFDDEVGMPPVAASTLAIMDMKSEAHQGAGSSGNEPTAVPELPASAITMSSLPGTPQKSSQPGTPRRAKSRKAEGKSGEVPMPSPAAKAFVSARKRDENRRFGGEWSEA